MHPEDIKAQLRKNGIAAARIAEQLDTTPAHISNVIHQRSRSERVAIAIANALHLPVNTIWPGKYSKRRKPGARRIGK